MPQERFASPFDPPAPRQAGDRRVWLDLHGDARALAIAAAARAHDGLAVIVTTGSHTAQELEQEIAWFLDGALSLQVMPDWETLPYDIFSPHQDIVSQRLRTLYDLHASAGGVLIVPAPTLMQRLAPVWYLEGSVVRMSVGEELSLDAMRQRLERAGYRCVSEVMEHGEFAVRGAILDLFPMGSDRPIRVDLFDNEIETLRFFDPETQRTENRTDTVEILPAREFPTGEDGTARFRQRFRASFEGDPTASLIYREVSEGRLPNGIEYYLPLFFDQTATLFDYLPENSLVFRVDDCDRALEADWTQIESRYEQRRHDRERPLLPPTQLYLDPDTTRAALNRFPQILVPAGGEQPPPGSKSAWWRFDSEALPDLRMAAGSDQPLQRLAAHLAASDARTLLLVESAGRREALIERLGPAGIQSTIASGWSEFLGAPAGYTSITVGPLEHGFRLPREGIEVIPEAALFAHRARQPRRRQRAERDAENLIRDLTDLHVGAPVVHEDHGVGRYTGLQTLDAGGVRTEFLTLQYAGGDKLYVPVSSLHLISRYAGTDPENAPLHRLGGEQWDRARRRAAEKARDVAAELLDIYARRAARTGHSYDFPQSEYERFADQFPFEETPDQETAIHAVINDLRAEQPMDRVVCGDVGFGKTEVAMRGAFVGVQDGHQVAVLVPTTLLAQQHYQNFLDRFADWPVRVELLSRFRSNREQQTSLDAIADGRADIVIGTHKLLQNSVRFRNLGLLIIDEEHRFGVRQKERLKAMRANVDVLTLTATPIPRTLNMSLAGMRDLSIIATPPARRLAVKTFVTQWNDALIVEACLREMHRGGQVYFLHNDVDSIDRAARDLQALLPDARIGVAHGQLPERELERVMLDFYHQRFSILVCSTIIESGIDVPTANTIIINRADRLGLAQLHQLRGRVGRSHHRAYAYLVAPEQRSMTADAAKRLEAISAHEDLGIGFTLASHDLEIRGAGELLGDGQSGQIQEIGFTLYSELLERAVQSLREGREPDLEAPVSHGVEIDLRLPALLPEDYLPDVHTRLVLYKRIASAPDRDALREIQVEMIDRFGLLPQAAKNLFHITTMKLQAQQLGLQRIEAGPGGGVVRFSDNTRVDPAIIVQLVQQEPAVYRLDGRSQLRFRLETDSAEARMAAVDRLLATLENQRAA